MFSAAFVCGKQSIKIEALACVTEFPVCPGVPFAFVRGLRYIKCRRSLSILIFLEMRGMRIVQAIGEHSMGKGDINGGI